MPLLALSVEVVLPLLRRPVQLRPPHASLTAKEWRPGRYSAFQKRMNFWPAAQSKVMVAWWPSEFWKPTGACAPQRVQSVYAAIIVSRLDEATVHRPPVGPTASEAVYAKNSSSTPLA